MCISSRLWHLNKITFLHGSLCGWVGGALITEDSEVISMQSALLPHKCKINSPNRGSLLVKCNYGNGSSRPSNAAVVLRNLDLSTARPIFVDGKGSQASIGKVGLMPCLFRSTWQREIKALLAQVYWSCH